MPKGRSLKLALLAASALAASGVAAGHAAAPMEPAPPPVAASLAHSAEEAARPPAPPVQNVAIAAAITAALAALYRLIGGERISRAVRKAAPVAAGAARAVAAAPVKVAKAAARAAASPLRTVSIFAGLGLFALAGVGFYDIEWLGGLVAGAGLVAFAWLCAVRARRVFVRPRAAQPRNPVPPAGETA